MVIRQVTLTAALKSYCMNAALRKLQQGPWIQTRYQKASVPTESRLTPLLPLCPAMFPRPCAASAACSSRSPAAISCAWHCPRASPHPPQEHPPCSSTAHKSPYGHKSPTLRRLAEAACCFCSMFLPTFWGVWPSQSPWAAMPLPALCFTIAQHPSNLMFKSAVPGGRCCRSAGASVSRLQPLRKLDGLGLNAGLAGRLGLRDLSQHVPLQPLHLHAGVCRALARRAKRKPQHVRHR